MKTITFGNGARTTVTPPTLNGDNIALAGTTAASEPFVIFADATAPSVIGTISEVGTFGVVETGPINQAAVPNLVVGSLMLSRGNLFMGTTAGGSVTITGTSYIANHSTYTAWGGRYQADTTTLKGTSWTISGSILMP